MIVLTTNCNRSYAEKDKSLSADFVSNIVDFKDMPMGSVQLVWRNVTGVLTGEVKLYGSILHEDPSLFDGGEIDGAVFSIGTANGNQLWSRDRLAFRYLQARYSKGGITGGTIDIVALGKKS